MFRYIAIAWNPTDEPQRQVARRLCDVLSDRAPRWHRVLQRAGLALFCADVLPGVTEPLFLSGNDGVVLGTLFPRPPEDPDCDPAQRANLDAAESAKIQRSHGRHLVAAYWGRYVAFLQDRASRHTVVLRDPSGGLPCLRVVHRRVNIFCSRIEDCFGLGLPPFTVNWDYVAAHSIFPFLLSQETGLNEVTQVRPGRALELRADGVREHVYWDPVTIATGNPLEDPLTAAAELRRIAKHCTHAWASRHGRLLHHLSGGLDSSIVLGCLQDAPSRPRITCVNYYSAGGDGDERSYARLAAQRAGCELLESARQPSANLGPLLHIARTVCPQPIRNRNVDVDGLESMWAYDRRATALFGGEGGDQLFYQNPAIHAAADYAHRHGLAPGLFRVACEAAQLANVSLWQVLRTALAARRHQGRRKLSDITQDSVRLVNRSTLDALADSERFRLSDIDAQADVPPGKRWHIDTLACPQAFYSPFARRGDPEPVEPLTSQPLVELGLRTPVYLSVAGAWDRAIARRAFGADVPADILWRRTKGGIDGYVKDALRCNARFVREMLLDGLLVQRGLLDRARLEEALGGAAIRTRVSSAEIFDHLTTEAWLRRWQCGDAAADYQRFRTMTPMLRPMGLALAPSK